MSLYILVHPKIVQTLLSWDILDGINSTYFLIELYLI